MALYWPSFSGLPVWDDISFLFFDPVMTGDFPYLEIWKGFTWPLSVSVQKALLSIVKKNYPFFHAVNFILHAFNSWLVYRLLRLLRVSLHFSFAGFLIFLIHPASVIAVAWMIQFKTLLCFTFTISSMIFFIRARSPKDYMLSVFLFLLSVLSKSSSLTFPFVLFFFLGKPWKTKKALWIIPYLLISLAGFYRLTHSKLTTEAISHASQEINRTVEDSVNPPEAEPKEEKPKEEKPAQIPPVEEPVQIQKAPENFTPVIDEPLIIPESDVTPDHADYKKDAVVDPTESNADDPKVLAISRLVTKTLYYYFWQAYLPLDNSPVKGLNPFVPKFSDYLHLVFLGLLIIISWKMNLLSPLIGAHLFLLPYLGIIPAPYMNVSWVSDQHLYLALPCFIIFLLSMADNFKRRWLIPLLIIYLGFFSWKTHEASGYFKDNFTFYETSIEGNLNNIPLVYNLSILYIIHGRNDDAIRLMDSIIDASQNEPYLKDNRFYPFLLDLRLKNSN